MQPEWRASAELRLRLHQLFAKRLTWNYEWRARDPSNLIDFVFLFLQPIWKHVSDLLRDDHSLACRLPPITGMSYWICNLKSISGLIGKLQSHIAVNRTIIIHSCGRICIKLIMGYFTCNGDENGLKFNQIETPKYMHFLPLAGAVTTGLNSCNVILCTTSSRIASLRHDKRSEVHFQDSKYICFFISCIICS